MVNYYQLGSQKKLNEIVMVGSHDAAITKGSKNVQTQALNIAEQAAAGVRIFDIRITGGVVGKGGASGTKIGQLQAFHGSGIATKSNKGNQNVINARTLDQGQMKIKPMTGVMGSYGETLSAILNQSREFVTENSTEFLILKFDKCDNWQLIAEACIGLLRDKIYLGGGNVNTKTLQQLAGSVIVVFGPDAWKTISSAFVGQGILKFKSLYSKDGTPGAYDPNFPGIQYIGKGGTDVVPWKKGFYRFYAGKMKENIKKQTKIMNQGPAVDPDVLGMMYWTTTGATANIRKRNAFLWNDKNQEKLVELWETRMPHSVDPTDPSAAPVLKTFMPNFVMVDFADATKCEKIFDLNFLSAMNAHNLAIEHYNAT